MAKLMFHKEVLKNFRTLPQKVQKRLPEFIERFQENPAAPELHVHSLKESMLDPKVRGANLPDGYRAIIIAPEKGDTYLLVHVNSHDEAYAWARNKRFEVHSETGVFQLFDSDQVQETVASKDLASKSGIFSKYDEEELFKAGVPQPLIPSVKAIENEEALFQLKPYLPPDCADVLLGLAAGLSIDEVLDEMLGLTKELQQAVSPESPGDFSHVEHAPRFDLILVEGEDSLREVLSKSLDEWRVFLHPHQRKLVEWQTRGAMSITGSAGTGKTVALIHRAIHLAKQTPGVENRVLITTFTTNLSITIKHYVHELAPEMDKRIEVTNLHSLARTICMRSGWHGKIADEETINGIWELVLRTSTDLHAGFSADWLRDEYFEVIEANGIDDEEVYLTTLRSGRPRVSREQRRKLWQVFREFQRSLKQRQLLSFDGVVHEARLIVERGGFGKYSHVLVDEVQDFSVEALRLIRALTPLNDPNQTHSDPLCVVGDGHQRIYRRPFPMSLAGINVRGRARRLKVNYRTSEQIRRFAQGVLQGTVIDDLDGGIASTSGDHSVMQGPEPFLERVEGEKAEVEAIAAWIQTLIKDHGLASHEICVASHDGVLTMLRQELTRLSIPVYELKGREEDPGAKMPGVRVGTMKRIKGLEFRAIAMACAAEEDAMNNLSEADAKNRCERYVAATRAREYLLVTMGR